MEVHGDTEYKLRLMKTLAEQLMLSNTLLNMFSSILANDRNTDKR